MATASHLWWVTLSSQGLSSLSSLQSDDDAGHCVRRIPILHGGLAMAVVAFSVGLYSPRACCSPCWQHGAGLGVLLVLPLAA